MLSGNFAYMTPLFTPLGIFHMPQIYDMGPTASAGFEPANLGTKGQHATPRPPKLLDCIYVPVYVYKPLCIFPTWTRKMETELVCETLVVMTQFEKNSVESVYSSGVKPLGFDTR